MSVWIWVLLEQSRAGLSSASDVSRELRQVSVSLYAFWQRGASYDPVDSLETYGGSGQKSVS